MGEELGYKLYWKFGDGELVPFDGIKPVEIADCCAELPAHEFEMIRNIGNGTELACRMTLRSEKMFKKSIRKALNKIMRTKRKIARQREKSRRAVLKAGGAA